MRLLFFLILFISDCKSRMDRFEVSDKIDSNFGFIYDSLYFNEQFSIYLNNDLLISMKGSSRDTKSNIHKYYNYPDSIKNIRLLTWSSTNKLIDTTINNSFPNSRVGLFISTTYPKSLDSITLDPNWKPTWKEIPIDSSMRRVVLEPDTLVYQDYKK